MCVLLYELNALQYTFNLVVFMESSSPTYSFLPPPEQLHKWWHLPIFTTDCHSVVFAYLHGSVYTYMRLHVCLFCTCASTQLTTVQQSSQFTRLSNTTYQTTPITQAILCLHPSTWWSQMRHCSIELCVKGSVNWLVCYETNINDAQQRKTSKHIELVQDLPNPSWFMGYIH